jgi:hypothetical protein
MKPKAIVEYFNTYKSIIYLIMALQLGGCAWAKNFSSLKNSSLRNVTQGLGIGGLF